MKIQKIVSFVLALTLLCGLFTFPIQAETVTSADYTDTQLDSSKYEVEKYSRPFWEGNIVYNECVYPIRNANEELEPFDLMYKADEIVSVRNYGLGVVYKEGRDYRLTEDGKLEILEDGRIGIIDYDYMHPTSNYNQPVDVFYPRRDGKGYEYWNEGAEFSRNTLAVTYIHNDEWDYAVQESLETVLPKTMSKLINQEPMTVVISGDSITWGAKGSGNLNIMPFADAYPEMTIKAFGEKFGNRNITMFNSNVGGGCSDWWNWTSPNTTMEEGMNREVISHHPDFVILCFGMNDASQGMSADKYGANMESQIRYIRQNLPECEILLLTSPYGNIYTFSKELYEAHVVELHKLAAKWDGVGVADAQTIEKGLLEKKDFLDFMADNMVHPNDMGMRLLCQTVLAAFSVSDLDSYKETVFGVFAEKVNSADPVNEWVKERLSELLFETQSAVNLQKNEWDITNVLDEAYQTLEKLLSGCVDGKHDFINNVVKPTCYEGGYTVSTCRLCGYTYTHSETDALGGEHIFDSGRQTKTPTYSSTGVFTKTCIRCGYAEDALLPALSDAPVIEGGMLHVANGYNYMQSTTVMPYSDKDGTVEFDICPLSLDTGTDVPYVGVWFAGYGTAASYNFREQRFEIVRNNLPYTGESVVLASKAYSWSNDEEYGICNWKKFAVKIRGNTVSIYLDGELMLSSTSEDYRSTDNYALIYSIGEYAIDSLRIGGLSYDPTSGEGTIKAEWDFDSAESFDSFNKEWRSGEYTDVTLSEVTEASVSFGHYQHEHQGEYLSTIAPGCALSGYDEYRCTVCGEIYTTNGLIPRRTCHLLVSRELVAEPSETEDGLFEYHCAYCDLTFTKRIPAGTSADEDVFIGDVNLDGEFNASDAVLTARYLANYALDDICEAAIDMNGDGEYNSADAVMMRRALAGWIITIKYN